jgi:hypothetical protein
VEQQFVFEHEPGFVFEGVAKPGESAVFTVAAHDGLIRRTVGDHALFLQSPQAAVLRVAVYSPLVASSGWEPYDQPAASAYMPLPLSAFERHDLPNGGVILVEARPKSQPIHTAVVVVGQHRFCELLNRGDVADIRNRLTSALASFDVPNHAVNWCVDTVERKMASWWNAAP